MGAATLVTFLLAAALGGLAAWSYLRRELPVPHRGLLLALRVVTLVLLAVLLTLPGLRVPGSGGGAPQDVVDASPSMAFAAPGEPAPRERAEEARTRDGGAPDALVFGSPDPGDGTASRLAPALLRAAEGGARTARVFSDLRVSDGPEALATAERLGLQLEVVDVGGPIASAGVAHLEAPASGRAGSQVLVEGTVFATAPLAGETAVVTLRRARGGADEVEVARDTVVLPGAGGSVTVQVRTGLPEAPGPVVWSLTVAAPGDGVGADDRRHAVTRVDPLAGIVALVSVRPDWEPRWLLPLLGETTGLPARGWLRVGDDAYLSMGDGGLFSADTLARVLGDARVVVVHGLDGAPPAWLEGAVAGAPRLLVLPASPAGAAAVGVASAGTLPGEWYPEPQASAAFAPALEGVDLATLPPLAGVLGPVEAGDPAAGGGNGVPGLVLTRPGGGRAPALLLREVAGERRVAVATARGFWRWAARGGDPATVHRRLFSGVVGWLLALEERIPRAPVGPEVPVVAAGGQVSWRLPPGRRVALRVEPADGPPTVDTVEVGAEGRAARPAPAVGTARWEVRTVIDPSAPAPDAPAGPWSGILVAEEWTDELRWPRDTLLAAGVAPSAALRPATGGIPLRTTPWPWLLAIALLCTEWVLRRRWGLR